MELFEYQYQGARWLASQKHALLADEMGLGKSAQAIHACDIIGAENILVFCPANARINWQREFDKFSQTKREFKIIKSESQTLAPGENAICSYEHAPRLMKKLNNKVIKWDVIISDEAHLLKTAKASRSQAVLGKNGFVHYAKRFWSLSGTPCPNNAGELWTMLFTFGITKLNYSMFILEYCQLIRNTFSPIGFQVVGTRMDKIPELQELLNKFMLRRLKQPGMLPPIHLTDQVIEIEQFDFSKEFASEFEKLSRRLEAASDEEASQVLEQIEPSLAGLRRELGLQKMKPICDIIEDELENEAYEKIVIFAIHRDVVEGIEKQLKRFNPVKLYGGMSAEEKQKSIDDFQNNGDVRVFIGNIQAAGTAITLTAAHQVAFFENDWTPANMAQALNRCHRIGQTKPVSVRFFSAPKTLDEKITRVVKNKTRQLTKLLDA